MGVGLRTSLGGRVPLDAQVLCQTLRQRPSHGQTVAILKTQETGKKEGYLPADAPGLDCYVVTVTSLTPTPRLREHMPPKYAALLLR